MQNNLKKLRLSPMLVAILATSGSLNLADAANAKNVKQHPQNVVLSKDAQFDDSVVENAQSLSGITVENPELAEMRSHTRSTLNQNSVADSTIKTPESQVIEGNIANSTTESDVREKKKKKKNTESETTNNDSATDSETVTDTEEQEVKDTESETIDNNVTEPATGDENTEGTIVNTEDKPATITDTESETTTDGATDSKNEVLEETDTKVKPFQPSTEGNQTTPNPDELTPTGEIQTTPTPVAEPAAPEPRVLVAEVVITGVTGELEDLIYRELKTEPGRTTTRSQLQEDVNQIYATGYFGNVTVTPEDTPLGVRITFAVEPNPDLTQVVVKTVPEDSENRVLPPEVVTEIFSPSYGDILNLRDLQDQIKELNKWYQDNGYDLAQVVGAPEISPDGTVTLVVAEGVIESLQVRYFDEEKNELEEGRTREFIITREAELKPGDVFNRNIARNDLQRIFGLGLFEDVRLAFEPGEDPSKVIVNLDVVEGKTGSLAAGLGISSASGLFGTASYQQNNIGGNNQKLTSEVQLGTRDFLFDIGFTDPWIGGDPFRTSYSVNAFRRQTISLVFDGGDNEIELENGDRPRVVRTGGGITFARPLPANPYGYSPWRLSLGFDYQHVNTTDGDGEIVTEDEDGNPLTWSAYQDTGEGDDLFTFQFAAVNDRRDDRFQPTKGSYLRLGVEQTIPIGAGSIFMNRIRGSYSYFVPVKLLRFTEGPQALAFNIQGGTILGDVPPYEAFSLGGTDSVRGYESGYVGSGSSFLQATAEYRFPVFKVVSGALFFDYGTDLGTAGNVPGDPAGDRDKPGWGFGYGVGVRVKSPVGPIRVDFALNDEGDTRWHLGIGERF